MTTISHSDVPPTAVGRQLLTHRLGQLETRLQRLRDALHHTDRTPEPVEEHRRTLHELERLHHVLATAPATGTTPSDPTVGIGDAITIELDDGTHEHYIVVHAIEAALDDSRISIDSPLGRALLGGHVGDKVDVETSAGMYGCTIAHVSRP